jgi:hypothetical protein
MRNYFYKLPTPLIITFFTVIGVAVMAGIGAIVMLLWNALVPAIFGITTINFWQALGLLILARIFFGGFRHNHSFRGKDVKYSHNHLFEKWKNMSPEERKEFIGQRHHWHGYKAEHFDERTHGANE